MIGEGCLLERTRRGKVSIYLFIHMLNDSPAQKRQSDQKINIFQLLFFDRKKKQNW